MTATITVRLLLGWYDAGGADDPDRAEPEWPPHPMRLFNALVDAAGANAACDEALRWLETQSPPEVWASAHVASAPRSTYVPTNGFPKEPKHTLYPGRVAAGTPKIWPRAIPARAVVHFVWPEAELTAAVFDSLGDLARTVAYLGRSTTPVIVEISRDVPGDDSLRRHRYVPDQNGTTALRVPFSGSLDGLRAAYRDGQPAREVRVDISYRSSSSIAESARPVTDTEVVLDGPYGDLITFAFRPSLGLDGAMTLAVTTQLRRACLDRCGVDVPASLHGHHGADRRHVAFVALPFARDRHATGRIMGVGIAIPRDVPDDDRRRILQAIVGSNDDEGLELLALPPPLTRSGAVALERYLGGAPTSVAAERWIGPSRRWASVTPVVLDRFPKGEANVEREIRRCCQNAGYREPARIEWSSSPFLAGGATPSPRQVRRRDDAVMPYRHVRLDFEQPLRGPVVLGRLRHFGVGLMIPMDGE